MIISDYIASIIEEMLREGGGSAEVKRNDLALRIGCVPSQINYVISSRFTPERGYVIESRRGGGGYIRIVKKQFDKNDYLMHFFHAIGSELSETEAAAYVSNLFGNGIVSEKEASIITAAMANAAFAAVPSQYRNCLRADILRHVILSLIR